MSKLKRENKNRLSIAKSSIKSLSNNMRRSISHLMKSQNRKKCI